MTPKQLEQFLVDQGFRDKIKQWEYIIKLYRVWYYKGRMAFLKKAFELHPRHDNLDLIAGLDIFKKIKDKKYDTKSNNKLPN